ncbi:Harbinger transposase-derived nuclease domain [Arabidopsis suecica]|uniref:Harbinger transposase-derived nuclease domain n=1 Tax=Arabidopsis suecica TaxID=45249 RepID=A0A8T2BJ71_ARASU|nr:Harbinger transposase-derived nuclease domain [Arabidopsis suecica]
MKFIYAYVGVLGRAHDTKVLNHCARNEPSFPHPPNGKYYLVDSGYPIRTGYLGPHRRMRYHLGQFGRGGPQVTARELFNRKHSATMTLHNFIRDSHRVDHDFLQWQSTQEYHVDEEDEEEAEEGQEGEEGEHIAYEPTGDRAMEALRDNITNEYNQEVAFFTDYSDLVKMVSSPTEWPAFSVYLEEFQSDKEEFSSFSLSLISRRANVKADNLARKVRTEPLHITYVNNIPQE